MIRKGKISSINYEERTAKVSLNNDENLSPMLSIPKHIDIELLKKETPVACVLFDDGTGAIICELWRC